MEVFVLIVCIAAIVCVVAYILNQYEKELDRVEMANNNELSHNELSKTNFKTNNYFKRKSVRIFVVLTIFWICFVGILNQIYVSYDFFALFAGGLASTFLLINYWSTAVLTYNKNKLAWIAPAVWVSLVLMAGNFELFNIDLEYNGPTIMIWGSVISIVLVFGIDWIKKANTN